MAKPWGKRNEKKVFERLKEAREFGQHRVDLLQTRADFNAELPKLRTALLAALRSATAKTSGLTSRELELRVLTSRPLAAFERRWQVRVGFSITSRGALHNFNIYDNSYPLPPQKLAPDRLDWLASQVAHDSDRYVVVDRHAPRKLIDEVLDYALPPGKKGRKLYSVKLDPGQAAEDIHIAEAKPRSKREYEDLVAELIPRPARLLGYVRGAGFSPEKADHNIKDRRAGRLQDEFDAKVVQVRRRWKEIQKLTSPR